MTKYLIFATCLVFGCGGLNAQQTAWQPSPGHTQVPIWPGAVPDAQPVASREVATAENKSLVAGRPWVGVGQVTRPTMTVYSPKGKNTGAAVVVFPGGGYQILAIDLEGTEVCDWLTSRGITCVRLNIVCRARDWCWLGDRLPTCCKHWRGGVRYTLRNGSAVRRGKSVTRSRKEWTHRFAIISAFSASIRKRSDSKFKMREPTCEL